MKYLTLVPDGCGDRPVESLGGLTPLEAAGVANINALAKISEVGLVRTVPEGFAPGSEANVTLLGYGPDAYLTGRAPLEAAAMGIGMAENDMAFRVNLVTLSGDGGYDGLTIKDHSAGEITDEEAEILMQYIDGELGGDGVRFYAGVGYRCLMISDRFGADLRFTPPHDAKGRKTGPNLPQGAGAETLADFQRRSYELLKNHPVNLKRVQNGQNPANSIWIWGQGKKLVLAPFGSKYGIKGSVVAAVNLVKGYGACAGLNVVKVPGADGTLHTNYGGKALAAIDEFKNGAEFVYLHVEAPDECSHAGDAAGKIKSLELIDEKIMKPVAEYLSACGEPYRILVVTDHYTLLSTRTHSFEPVPFVLYDSERKQAPENWKAFSESAGAMGRFFKSGSELADYFFRT
ncbi:MAG: cofactor-independent phosphoglycerate mutase [Firmicutes bacterium]|nr:cofactor-independent phosphoglycerate mutase [Bacillota bacterium]